MESVGHLAREEMRKHVQSLSDAQRIELALELGDADVAMFSAANGLDGDTAREQLRAQRQQGRRHSPCLQHR